MHLSTKIVVVLVAAGIIALFLPESKTGAGDLSPKELQTLLAEEGYSYSADEVARFIVEEDTTIQLIDLRSLAEFIYVNLPGSINIPYEKLLSEDYSGYIDQDRVENVLYANGDILANQALTLLVQQGHKKIRIMEGGLNEWYRTVMLSEFKGERITPRENAIFENRYRARKFFTQMNSLPDSLKRSFLAVKKAREMELVGGCE
jgi:rhodanese-related sulfurtransferase